MRHSYVFGGGTEMRKGGEGEEVTKRQHSQGDFVRYVGVCVNYEVIQTRYRRIVKKKED